MIHNNPLEQKGIIQQIEKANIVEGLFRHYSTNRNTLLRSYARGVVSKIIFSKRRSENGRQDCKWNCIQ